jgi:hypothetical protein
MIARRTSMRPLSEPIVRMQRDGIGRADIPQHRHGGDLAVERTALSQSGSLGTVSSNWIIAETGERDPWRDNNTRVAAIWFLDGPQIASSASLGTVDLIG